MAQIAYKIGARHHSHLVVVFVYCPHDPKHTTNLGGIL